MGPGMRKLEGEYYKTIVIVLGQVKDGKSTICNVLWNEEVNYLSADAMGLQTDHDIVEILSFLKEYGESAKFYIGTLNQIINKNCGVKFVDYIFDKYIKNNENKNILLDGHIFIYPTIKEYFVKKYKEQKYRVWELKRT